MIKKPMLAASMENNKGEAMTFKDLKYPLGASVKLDGIRCLRVDGKTLSRSFKPIPNKYVQAQMANLPDGLDGELVVLEEAFSGVQSGIMSRDGEPKFEFKIFDYVKDSLDKPYIDRMKDLSDLFASGTLPAFCSIVSPVIISNEAELIVYEDQMVKEGHEGIMTRNLQGKYKCGRSTWNSQDLVKIKRFKDSEAVIIGFEEKMHNANEATTDELGHTKRSSAKDGLVPAGTLGTFLVRDVHDHREFGIGTGKGLNDELKKHIWDNKDQYLGKIINYRYQEVGTKDLPRIPSFQGFRDERDMSE